MRRSRSWVYRWIRRYESGGPLWSQDRSHRPHHLVRQVSVAIERMVVRIHRQLKSKRNPLGFWGAEAIHHALTDLGVRPLPSSRTIHRILVRRHLVTRKRRDRSRRGPLLPVPAAHRQNDVHQLDFIVGHYLASQLPFVVINRKDVASGLVSGTIEPDRRVQRVVAFLIKDWHRSGRPKFLQMDNDMSLIGGRFHPRSLGQLVRFCLACRVIPVFIPERRPASNAHVERYNGLWQEKVWKRYWFHSLGQLQTRSQTFQEAYNTYLKRRLIRQGESCRFQIVLRPLPKLVRVPHPLTLCRGQIWIIRRVDDEGHIRILNETIRLSVRYAHEFVRVVLRTGPQTLSVYWKPSGQRRLQRIAHRSYKLREKAETPLF